MSRLCYLSVGARKLGACEQAAFAGLPGGCSGLPTHEAGGCSLATLAERPWTLDSCEDA
jgi:hypothetical protein